MPATAIGPVVVGVDGSDASRDALRWAADYAAMKGLPLKVIIAWHWPTGFGFPIASLPEDYIPADDAAKILQDTISDVLSGESPVPITTEVVEGPPAPALVEASKGASLLAVGSRGHGGFAGLLLGSVSEHCAAHASCPVLIQRHAGEDEH